MKKSYYSALLVCATATTAQAQLNVAYHQSNLPFVAASYDFGRFHPDFRLSTDAFTAGLSPELTLNYKLLNKDDYYVYAGVGGRTNNLAGGVLPVGVVAFPFAKKRLGFHTELAVIGIGNGTVLRGSWGIKFRFGRTEEGPGL
ncbi:MAG TPA: hypothetical protein VF629_00240 [Hymenobacter sp.]|jgi:hypothetical protein|uniref:hypothetical protein n=1 Tax=Hymenobacter sp. TaxID=1898978 RepID=UPI002ED8671D